MSVQVGQKAPDFSLFNSEKQKLSLTDYSGKRVVLLFFPLAFTSVCTEELCAVRDNISFYSNLNAQVIGISVDSLYTLAKYKEEQKLSYPLLSDFNKEVSTAYGCLYEQFGYGMKGVSKRAAFVLDEEGIVQYAEVLENAGNIPDFNAVNSALMQG